MTIPIPPDKRYFKCFPLNAINLDSAVPPHHDTQDDRNGICCSVPFGDFEYGGGRLHLHDFNMDIDDWICDMVAFQGYNLKHSVSPHTKTRFACILTTHDTVFFPPDPNCLGKDNVKKIGSMQHSTNKK